MLSRGAWSFLLPLLLSSRLFFFPADVVSVRLVPLDRFGPLSRTVSLTSSAVATVTFFCLFFDGPSSRGDSARDADVPAPPVVLAVAVLAELLVSFRVPVCRSLLATASSPVSLRLRRFSSMSAASCLARPPVAIPLRRRASGAGVVSASPLRALADAAGDLPSSARPAFGGVFFLFAKLESALLRTVATAVFVAVAVAAGVLDGVLAILGRPAFVLVEVVAFAVTAAAVEVVAVAAASPAVESALVSHLSRRISGTITPLAVAYIYKKNTQNEPRKE